MCWRISRLVSYFQAIPNLKYLGMILTLADMGLPKIRAHGPRLRELLHATRFFVRR